MLFVTGGNDELEPLPVLLLLSVTGPTGVVDGPEGEVGPTGLLLLKRVYGPYGTGRSLVSVDVEVGELVALVETLEVALVVVLETGDTRAEEVLELEDPGTPYAGGT